MKIIWQVFVHPHGKVAVPAPTEELARQSLARDHWSKKDPGWSYDGTMVVPRPPWSDWSRLERWASESESKEP